MEQRGYRVRVEAESVEVEHRASFRPRTLCLLAIAYVAYCCLPAVRRPLMDFIHSPDLFVAAILLLMLLIPWIGGVTWLMFASGEVLRCDRKELRFATRKTFGHWHRYRFATAEVERMERIIYGGPKRRTYPVLTFKVQGRSYRMLEDISDEDSDRILNACKAMGYDVFIDQVGKAMLRDIEKRGWWVNPMRPDNYGTQNPPADLK